MMFPLIRTFFKLTFLITPLIVISHSIEVPKKAVAQEVAQEYDQQQLRRYAEALLEIEPLREKTYQEIQTLLNSEVPNIACNREDSYQDLPREVRSLIITYCNQSRAVVEGQGLTVSQFNQITTQVRSNSELKKQIQQEMLQLQ